MHRFSRMHLSAAEVLKKLDAIDLEEKTRIAEGIALIAVIDNRRDYLGAGYSCMRDYCMGRLHMSEDKALRRIQVARVALQFPEIFECLAAGRLSVTTASELAPHLTSESAAELLAASAFQAKHDIRRLIAERSKPSLASPGEPAKPCNVEASSSSLAPAHVNSLADLCASPPGAAESTSLTPAHVDKARRGRVTRGSDGGHEVRLSITDEEHDDLCRAQALLGHAVPSGDPAVIYARAMKHYLALLERRRLGVKPASAAPAPHVRGRGIPKPLQRLVWERDGGKCAFVSADGHRCDATRRLEIDHIQPLALGGATTPENLRLLCRPHNQYEAERLLGKDHVAKKREFARSERARKKAASTAESARAKAREEVRVQAQEEARPEDVARSSRRDDIGTALRGLGFTVVEANRGVELTDSMPEASLEACVRHALTQLTRSVTMRGERRARCSA